MMNAKTAVMDSIEIDDIKIYYRKGSVDESLLNSHIKHQSVYFIPEYIAGDVDVVIDVGAHIGAYAMCATKILAKSKIYAIEACSETFHYLKKNIEENKFENIRIFNLALTGNNDDSVKLYHNLKDGSWGHSTSEKISDKEEIVPACSLSRFLSDNGINRCDFIKFNCEGAEYDILLNSSREVLRKIKLMLVLYHGDLSGRYKTEDLIAHLKDCGFKISIRDHEKRRGRGWMIAKGPDYAVTFPQSIWIFIAVQNAKLKILARKFKNRFFASRKP